MDLRHKATSLPEPTGAASILDEALRSPSRPLDGSVRAFMEPRFRHDFSQVRVHTDESAAASAQAVDADAYVAGNHIVFGAGQYAPGTPAGRRTLAHELAHVVQQSAAPTAPARPEQGLTVSHPADAAEVAADRAADAIVGTSREAKAATLLTASPASGRGRSPLLRQVSRGAARRGQQQGATPQQAATEADESEKEAEAWDLARTHFRPELLIKFQEIGRAAGADARKSIDATFAPYEKEISTPDQTFLNIFLGGAGNVPQGEMGGFLGGAAAAGLQAAVGFMLNTKSVAEVKENARNVPEDVLATSLTTDSPYYAQFEHGAMADLFGQFEEWWQAYPQHHDDKGQIRVEALLLEQTARDNYGANSPLGSQARAALTKLMEPGLAPIREELEDLQDAYRRKRDLRTAASVGAGIGAVVGGVAGGFAGAGTGLGIAGGAAVGALIGGLGVGALTLGGVALSQAFTPTPKELRERRKKQSEAPK